MIYHPLTVSMTTTLTGMVNMTYPLLMSSMIYVIALYGCAPNNATLILCMLLLTSHFYQSVMSIISNVIYTCVHHIFYFITHVA